MLILGTSKALQSVSECSFVDFLDIFAAPLVFDDEFAIFSKCGGPVGGLYVVALPFIGLKVGDRIITTSGIYGQITKIGEQSVKVQIADKVTIEIARAAIGGLQGQEPLVPVGGDQNGNV